MRASIFEQMITVPVHIPAQPDTIERAKQLSEAFEVLFRTFAQSPDGFSGSAVQSLESALSVLKIRNFRSAAWTNEVVRLDNGGVH